MDTIFHKIISKDIPASIVHEDDDVIAFRDINPAAPVHVLVVPKNYISGFSKFSELSDEQAGAYMKKIAFVADKLGLSDGYRVVFNQGEHGGQTVPYIHAHILGGGKLPGHSF